MQGRVTNGIYVHAEWCTSKKEDVEQDERACGSRHRQDVRMRRKARTLRSVGGSIDPAGRSDWSRKLSQRRAAQHTKNTRNRSRRQRQKKKTIRTALWRVRVAPLDARPTRGKRTRKMHNNTEAVTTCTQTKAHMARTGPPARMGAPRISNWPSALQNLFAVLASPPPANSHVSSTGASGRVARARGTAAA